MDSKFKNLKNSLDDLEGEDYSRRMSKQEQNNDTNGYSISRFILLGAFVVTFLFYVSSQNFSVNISQWNPFQSISEIINQPDEDLLNRMNALMVEMGYGEMTHEELTELRNQGLTATYVASVRELGFTDLSVEDAVRLRQADVSATFIAMMNELGYDLELEDLIRLRRNNVTAFYTSNLHDLGYTDVSIDELIRLRQIGVTTTLIDELRESIGADVTLDEIIRYRISNQ